MIRRPVAYPFPDFSQPNPGPGEFHAENRQTDRNHYYRGPGRNNHDNPNGENGAARDEYGNSPRGLVGNIGSGTHRCASKRPKLTEIDWGTL